MNSLLRVKYTVYYYCIAAAVATCGIWLIFWHIPEVFNSREMALPNNPSGVWGVFNLLGSLILGWAFIYYSVVGALWVKNKLPDSEQLWLRQSEREKQRDEERRHRQLAGDQRRREYEAEQVEESRQRIAQLPALELKRKQEEKANEERRRADRERREADKTHNKEKRALYSEIHAKKEAVEQKLELDALTRKKETAEQDAKAEYEARKARAAAAALAAWEAAHPPKTPEPSEVSRHLTDKQIEQIALKAFRRISNLSKEEQDEAWQEWADDLSGEYDDYVEAEIIARVYELRGDA